ncbi:MAG: hypothetical protein ACBR20_27115 [Microcoleus sp.]
MSLDRQFTLFLVMIGYRWRSLLKYFDARSCYRWAINLLGDDAYGQLR